MRQSASLPWIGRRRTRVRYSSSVSFSGMSSSQLPEASAGTESSDCNSNSASTGLHAGPRGSFGVRRAFRSLRRGDGLGASLGLGRVGRGLRRLHLQLGLERGSLGRFIALGLEFRRQRNRGRLRDESFRDLTSGLARREVHDATRATVRRTHRGAPHRRPHRRGPHGRHRYRWKIRVDKSVPATRALHVTNRCQRGKRVDVGLQMSNYLVVTSNTPFPILARIREKISRSVSRVIDRLTAAHEIGEIGGLGIAPRRHSISCGLSRLWPLRTAGATPAA